MATTKPSMRLVQELVEQLSKKDVAVIQRLAKGLPKDTSYSSRWYAGYVCIRGNYAYITQGFSCLRAPLERTYDTFMCFDKRLVRLDREGPPCENLFDYTDAQLIHRVPWDACLNSRQVIMQLKTLAGTVPSGNKIYLEYAKKDLSLSLSIGLHDVRNSDYLMINPDSIRDYLRVMPSPAEVDAQTDGIFFYKKAHDTLVFKSGPYELLVYPVIFHK